MKLRLEWIALIFIIFAGIILTFLTPRLSVLDEAAHLHRAYQISELIFISPVKESNDGERVLIAETPLAFFQPQNVHNIAQFLAEPLNENERITSSISNTGSYSPVAYFPQALAAYITRSLGCTAGQIYYAMRAAAVLFVALCIFWSIRILPEKGLLIFVLSMMSMFLVEIASASADPAVYGICIFVSAYLLSLRKHEDKLTFVQMSIILFMAVIVGLVKQVYGTILLLYFVMPYKRLGTRTRYISFGFIVLAACLISSLVWTYISSVRLNVSAGLTIKEADVAGQLNFIMANPMKVLMIFIKNNLTYAHHLASSFIGISGWLHLNYSVCSYILYSLFILLYVILILTASVHGNLNLSLSHKLIIIAGSLATLFAIDMFEYLTYNAPGSSELHGLQGRYFIPIALMTLSIFSCRPSLRHEKIIALTAGLVSIMLTVSSIYIYFYF